MLPQVEDSSSQTVINTGPSLGDPERLAVLRRTALLDSPVEESFDRMTRLATRVLHAPVALVSLVDEDRQFFKSCIGLPQAVADERETPLSQSFCRHTVSTRKPLIIEDARQHPLVRDNLAIPDLNVIAYAGIPLITSDGFVLGSFCVIDFEPRVWTVAEIEILEDLAASVMTEIELRLITREAREAVELRDRVLSVVTHDLKSPLTVIKGYSSLLERRIRKLDLADATPLLDAVGHLNDAASKMNRQIDELLEVSKLQTGLPLELRREQIDLVALIREVAEDSRHTSSNHRIKVQADADLIVGAWDRARLERVFDNLISNAIKYSPAGGDIQVRLGVERRAEQEGLPAGADKWATVRVQDQGMGIAADDLPHIFDWYYRAAHTGNGIDGSGIGLASAQGIARQHGGVIRVASRQGAGSTFTVYLPLD